MSTQRHRAEREQHSQTQSLSIRAINRGSVIALIRQQPGLTRGDLSRISGLSKGTISNLVTELLEEQFLYEDDRDGSQLRNTRLRLNHDAGICVALELSADACRGIATDPELHVLRRVQRPMKSTRVEEAIELILTIIAELQAGSEQRRLGVALAVPGLTDAKGQTMVISESLGWSDVPLAQRLHERLLCPVTLINRTRAGALGEHLSGAGVGEDDLLYVSISSGIGVGIVLGSRLFTGAYGRSGELGHTTVVLDGPQCGCGNRGCLETVASIPAIIRGIQARLQNGEPSLLHESSAAGDLSYQQILAAVRDGDALALDEMRQACRYIGVAVANLIDILNPGRVIIGGQLAEAGEIVMSTIRETVQRRSFVPCYSGVQIVRTALGLDCACIGACSVVLEQYIAQVESAWPARAR